MCIMKISNIDYVKVSINSILWCRSNECEIGNQFVMEGSGDRKTYTPTSLHISLGNSLKIYRNSRKPIKTYCFRLRVPYHYSTAKFACIWTNLGPFLQYKFRGLHCQKIIRNDDKSAVL